MAKLKVIWNKYVKLKKEKLQQKHAKLNNHLKKTNMQNCPGILKKLAKFNMILFVCLTVRKSHLRTALQVTLLDF